MRSPRCLLMCGLPGSGKTRLAMFLAGRGFTRICPDEEMFRRFGRYGSADFPRGEFPLRERPVLDEKAVELRQALSSGQDVVFDHGFWTPEERTTWSNIVRSAGGSPVLAYLPTPHAVLWARIKERNRHADVDPNSVAFSEEDLLRYAARFHPPEHEPHIVYDGQPEAILSVLASADTPEGTGW